MQDVGVAPGEGGGRRLRPGELVDLLVHPAAVAVDVVPEPGHDGVSGRLLTGRQVQLGRAVLKVEEVHPLAVGRAGEGKVLAPVQYIASVDGPAQIEDLVVIVFL